MFDDFRLMPDAQPPPNWLEDGNQPAYDFFGVVSGELLIDPAGYQPAGGTRQGFLYGGENFRLWFRLFDDESGQIQLTGNAGAVDLQITRQALTLEVSLRLDQETVTAVIPDVLPAAGTLIEVRVTGADNARVLELYKGNVSVSEPEEFITSEAFTTTPTFNAPVQDLRLTANLPFATFQNPIAVLLLEVFSTITPPAPSGGLGGSSMLPDVRPVIKDGGLGILPELITGRHVKVGVSSAGAVGQLYSFSSPPAIVDTLNTGELVEAGAWQLANAGGSILLYKAAASVAGVYGAVTPKAGNTSSGVVDIEESAVGASPFFDAAIVVKITRATGVANLTGGAFVYSLDGGQTFSPEVAITAGGYVVPNSGVKITFTAGSAGVSFVVGETFSATMTAPKMNTADLMAALDALNTSNIEFEFIHVLGEVTPAIAAAVDLKMQAAQQTYRYIHTILEARKPTAGETAAAYDTAVDTEYAGFESTRVSVVVDNKGTLITSPLNGRRYRRNLAWSYAARLSTITISTDPARVADGALKGILADDLGRNEFRTEFLDARKFTTGRTFIGLSGAYITNGRMFASPISDFRYVVNRRVMDTACRLARIAGLRFLNDSVRVDPATGFILEADARAIEAFVKSSLETGLLSPNHVSAVDVQVKRDNNILADGTVYITISVTPKGYARQISETIGFRNPANIPAAPPPAAAPAG